MRIQGNHSFALLLSVVVLWAWGWPLTAQAVGNSVVIAGFNMDSDPGWTTEGQWQFGQPQGLGGDPSSGYTGANVYGYNLGGQYPNSMPRYYLTTTAINCSNYADVVLTFRRWLGVESRYYDHAGIEVSNDGSTWTSIWEHSGGGFTDTSWVEMSYDISAVADGQATVYIRWGMGTTDGSVTYCGWNIDDVSLTGDVLDDLFITPMDAQVVSGYERGPFTPTNLVFEVQNNGLDTLSWSAGCTHPWLHLSSTGGVFAAGSTGTVQVSFDPEIQNWGPATNIASIVFSNETSGFVQYREVRLEIAERLHSGFTWEYVPTNQVITVPIPIRIEASDQAGDVFSSFSGQANLSAFTGGGISAVGYYDMDVGAGSVYQLPSVETSGNTPVQLFTLDSDELASIDVLYAQNQGGNFGSEYISSMSGIEAAVSNGCVLIIHDRTVSGSAAYLPGGSEIILTKHSGTNIEIGDAPEILTNGPGGVIDNESLDGGSSSHHGYATVASLPAGSHVLLTTAQTNQAVTFSYPYGHGWVIYSTIPLDFYLSRASATPLELRTTYAPNIVAYGVELGGGGEQSVSITPEYTGAFTSGVWTGMVTFLETGTNIELRVDDGSDHIGVCNPITVENLKLTVVLPEATTEGDPAFSGQLTANYPPSSDLLIALDTPDANSITIPTDIVMSAGQSSVMFDVQGVDDDLLDGTTLATVTATATNYLSGADSMYVHDNESATLTVSLPQTTYEGAGTISGAIVSDAAPDADVVVHLISNNTNEIGSGSIVIPAGQNFATLTLPVYDDSAIDGVQTATIEAHVENWQSGYASVFVFDNETTGIDLQLPATLTEGDGVITNGGVLSIPAAALADINLLLTCSNPTELDVPDYVTIPVGTNQVAFDISVIDDMEPEGMTTVSILAQAPGYIPDSSSIAIVDNDPHHLLVEGLYGNLTVTDPVSIAVSARTQDGNLVEVFSEPVSLTASGDRGAVGITPSVLTNMIDGVASGTVAFGHIGNDVILLASGGSLTGTSTAFNVTGSQIAVSPASLTNTLVVADATANRTMIISNAGNADLEFEIQVVAVFTNLVSNGDFEAGNSGFTSSYVYTPLPNSSSKGIYTVAGDSQTWNGDFTPTMNDHTSGDGKMLMANGNSTGTAMVWQQEVPVTAGITYNLSAWAASLFGEFLPLLDFQVNGESVGSMATENLTWTEFTAQWKSISSGMATFSITDTQFIPPFLPSNHFALDDIVFQPFSWKEVESDPGLVASYPFAGDASDSSINLYDATPIGATLTTNRTGQIDSAYYFDGVNDRIDLPSAVLDFERTNSFSESFWMKSGYSGTTQYMIAKLESSGAYRGVMTALANGLIHFQLISNTSTRNKIYLEGTTALDDGQWHHIAVTYDGSSAAGGINVYIDGSPETVMVLNDSLTGSILNSVTPTIGSRSSQFYYKGALDDVRIYNRVLSAAEVAALYAGHHGGKNPFETTWLSADPVAGIIPPGTNMAVAAIFDAAGMVAGDHTNALLKVTCNDVASPSNDVTSSMYVLPPAPQMTEEPGATYGASNTVSWNIVAGPVAYLVEVAPDTVSAALQQSDWMVATNHTFNALATNQMYYYRARASVESDIGRLEGPWSGWVWSTQLPFTADTDADGIPDWWEELHFGSTVVAGLLTDSDGDGQSDHDEFVAGMNPTNPASYFMMNGASLPTNGQFVVYWDSVSGRVYSVHWSLALTNAFTPMATNILYPQGSYTDEVHQAEDSGYYKVTVDLEGPSAGDDGPLPPSGGGGPPPPPLM